MKWTLVILLSLKFSTADSPPNSGCSVTAEVGETVILPVKVDLPENSELLQPIIKWKTEKGDNVHEYWYNHDNNTKQNERFKGRTSLFKDEIKKGNISLKITNITTNDAGNYTCEVRHTSSSSPKRLYVSLWFSVSAKVGETVILPVKVDLREDSELLQPIIKWKNERGSIVHDYWYVQDSNEYQDERFKGRTSLFKEEIKKGNVSLKITNITTNDAGNYTCEVHIVDDDNTYKVYLYVLQIGEHGGSTQSPEPKSPGLTSGQTTGIVTAVVIVLAAAALIGLFLYKRRTLTERPSENEGQPDQKVRYRKKRKGEGDGGQDAETGGGNERDRGAGADEDPEEPGVESAMIDSSAGNDDS